MTARDHVPSTPAGFHRMVDGGAALADHVPFGVFERQQCLIESVGDRGGDRGEAGLSKAATILEDVPADQLETVFVVALALGVQLGVAAVGSILADQPVERSGDGWRR